MHREYEIPPDSPFYSTAQYPLTRCGVGSYAQVYKWKDSQKKKGVRFDGEIEYIHDRNDKHRGALAAAMLDVFNIDVIFKDKAEAVPLQAADMLAWEHARSTGDLLIRGKSVMRPDIFKHIPGAREWTFSSWPKMKEWCEENGFKKKQGSEAAQ
jgi:hypothetical protein